MRLKKAIIEFLANELHLDSANLHEETSFAELEIDAIQLPELLHRLQDALGIVFPEDKLVGIETIFDLLQIVDENESAY